MDRGEVGDTGEREEGGQMEFRGQEVSQALDQWFTNLAAHVRISWRALNKLAPRPCPPEILI